MFVTPDTDLVPAAHLRIYTSLHLIHPCIQSCYVHAYISNFNLKLNLAKFGQQSKCVCIADGAGCLCMYMEKHEVRHKYVHTYMNMYCESCVPAYRFTYVVYVQAIQLYVLIAIVKASEM